MIKLLFSDVDGTLLLEPEEYRNGMSGETLAAIRLLKDSGVSVAIATGRHHTFFQSFEAHPDLVFDTVAYNGGYIYWDGDIVYHDPFQSEELLGVIRDFPELVPGMYAKSVDGTIAFTCKETADLYGGSDSHGGAPQPGKAFLPPAVPDSSIVSVRLDLEHYLKTAKVMPCQAGCFLPDTAINLPEWVERIDSRYAGRMHGIITSCRSFAIMRAGNSKASGIRLVAERLGLSMEKIAVVGDSYNDVDMFGVAGYSLCMFHAPSDVRGMADATVLTFSEAARAILERNKAGKQHLCV